MSEHSPQEGHDHAPETGLKRWLFTTNHKDIGTLYLVFALLMLFVGGAMSLVIRAELFQPGLQFVNPDFFNQMTTLHALIMVFGMIMPNTMMSACRVVIWLKKSGFTNCRPGWKSSARMTRLMAPPTNSISRANTRYRVPMSLWLVVNNQRFRPVSGA